MKNNHILYVIILLIAICCSLNRAYSQASSAALGNSPAATTDYIGWNGATTIPLKVSTNAHYRINFYTDSTFRVVIDTTRGYVGIGNYFNAAAPLNKLDVDSGDINIGRNGTYDNFGYRIGGNYVLWHKGNPKNIFIGVGAGASNTTGIYNTFSGDSAGYSDTTANRNTLIGHVAGYSITGRSNATAGSFNCFIGDSAGFANDSGNYNVILGAQAGLKGVNTSRNVYIGYQAGKVNIQGGSLAGGTGNVYVGYQAGLNDSSGLSNTFMGDMAGWKNIGGQMDTYIGFEAGQNAKGNHNTMTGYHCGMGSASGETGSENSYYGDSAGEEATSDSNNSFFGSGSGTNSTGSQNSFFGGGSGNALTSGAYNCIFGYSAGSSPTQGDSNVWIGAYTQKSTSDVLRNSIAIGFGAIVKANRKMILGDTTVWVGIGLSNDQSARKGPTNSLEINARNNTTGDSIANASGLRFRQLNAKTGIPKTNIWPASNRCVLTVDSNGDVVLVKDSIGNGSGGPGIHACSSSAANYIPFFYPNDTTLCNSIIYQDSANSRIGISTTTPSVKLDVNGAINIPLGTDTADSYRIGGHPWMWTNGISNTFLGYQAGNAIPSGGINTFIGVNAGYNTTSGYNNTYLGYSTGFNNTTGQDNVSIGEYAGYANKTGSYNISIGTEAAQNDSSSGNVIIGHNAGVSTQNTGTTYNVFVGEEAGSYNGTGISNTYMGGQSGTVNSVSGSYNTLLGYGTNLGHDSLKYATAIGSNATIYSSYAISLGQSGDNSNPGFGNTTVLIGYNTVPSVLPDTTVLLYVNSANVAGGQSAYFNGHCYSTGWFSSSDAKLKTNVQDIQDANTVLDKITAKSFRFDQTDYPSLHLPSGSHYGVIAQDVEAVMPSAVQTVVSPPVVDSIGNVITPSVSFKAVNYSELIPLLMASNKQQRQAIDSLQSQLTQLQTTVSNCCASSSGTGARMMAAPSTSGTVIPVDLHNAILLEQNSPNPFAEHTTINYNVGSEIQSAQIVFFDNTGRILKSVVITERGPGMLDVYAGDLSSGMYSYSLIADGQVLDTKKMVRMK